MIRIRPKLHGVLTGLLITALCILYFFVIDRGRQLESLAFDLRMRLCSTLKASTPIVHLDIDDDSLTRVGRWPWRRIDMADLLRALSELSPSCIMVDLLLSERERPFIDDPQWPADRDIDPPKQGDVAGECSEENIVLGDLELADAIRSAGNVILSAQVEALSKYEPANRRIDPAKETLRQRIRKELLTEFALTDEELARRLGTSVAKIGEVVAGVKSSVAIEQVGRLFAAGRRPPLDEALTAILGPAKGRDNADRMDVLSAYRTNLGLAEMGKALHPLAAGDGSRLRFADEAVPLYFDLAQAAADISAVNSVHDVDGTVRRVPLVVRYGERLLKHMGLAAACRILGLDARRMSLSPGGRLTIPSTAGDKTLSVPLDENGDMIIPWTETAKNWLAGQDFRHIPATMVWTIADNRNRIKRNETNINIMLSEAIKLAAGTNEAAYNAYVQKVNALVRLEREIRFPELRRQGPAKEIEQLRLQARQKQEEIQQIQRVQISNIDRSCADLKPLSEKEIANDSELRDTAKRFREAHKIIHDEIPKLQAANKELEQIVDRQKGLLEKIIKGKYVFLGYAATAEGDIVKTSIDPRTNGVMCHAAVLNALLQNHFIAPPKLAVDVAVCFFLGAVVSLITALSYPRLALLVTLTLMAIYAEVNAYLLFGHYGLWVSIVAPLVAMFVTWSFVTLFRQLTAEREKRLFAKELGQYTSPLLAAKIAESPEAAKAFKTVQTREVTCFFSDLKGFTTISEQVDAETVQFVLNTYLQRMSQTIWDQRGFINKFMGDGIMAFFNPSVDPLPDHAHIACETSLVAIDELEKLKAEQKSHTAEAIFDQLHMRIGLSTGLVKNGDMGSAIKADYTIIGDVVNLGARLEPANKVFGTQILVAGPTRDAVKDAYEFRYLAELQVKGKAQTVPVYEICCRKGELTPEQAEYNRRFEVGVELYKARKWDECIVHFTRILARRFDDAGASRYIEACQEFKAFPPDDDWRGALELKEK